MTQNNSMIKKLSVNGKEITLIGTAHVSRESADIVTKIITNEAPDTVCVELCQSRYQSITDKDRWQNMDIVKVIKEKKTFLLLSNLLLASFQKKIADKFDIQPGQEMLAAIESAQSVNAEIFMADREIHTTLSRTWRAMSLFSKVKLFIQLIFSIGNTDDIQEEDIERMKNEDVLQTLLADVEKSHPVLRDILIDERDQYLAYKIRSAPGSAIVAVVGAGHVSGIISYIDKPIDIDALETIPPKSPVASAVKWLLPAIIIGMISYGFYLNGSQAGASMIGWWIAANGILAGIGAILAFAHPLTILAAIVAAPLTSLNPMIAAGWVSGMVEVTVRKPRVIDLENLQEDTLSFKGFWRNKVTRVLLVVVFTNLGSTFGTLVAIPMMAKVMG